MIFSPLTWSVSTYKFSIKKKYFKNQLSLTQLNSIFMAYQQNIKTESIRKLSNFNFQWTKPCTRIMTRNIFHTFRGLWNLYEITPKKRFLFEPDKTNLTKLQKLQISQNEILCLIIIFTCVFSIPAKFEFIFLGSHKKFSLVLLQITNNYNYSPWKVQKRIQYGLKYSGTKFLSTGN